MIAEVKGDRSGVARVEMLGDRWPRAFSIPRSLHLFGSQILWASRKRYLEVHLSDPTSDGVEGVKGYGRMKALAAQLCEGKALLCWMVAEKQYLARGLATNEPYLCLLLSFPGPFFSFSGSLAWPTRWMVVQGSEVKGWAEVKGFSLSLSQALSIYPYGPVFGWWRHCCAANG